MNEAILRKALKFYACEGLGACQVARDDHGACLHAINGRSCGHMAVAALDGRDPAAAFREALAETPDQLARRASQLVGDVPFRPERMHALLRNAYGLGEAEARGAIQRLFASGEADTPGLDGAVTSLHKPLGAH